MNLPPIYNFQRGAPFSLALIVDDGDPTGYTVTAGLKPLSAGQSAPDAGVPIAAVLTVTFVASAAGVPARWLLSMSAAQTLSLPAGRYICDGKVLLAGAVVDITEPVIVTLKNTVSG
jgi:hypothetical protein